MPRNRDPPIMIRNSRKRNIKKSILTNIRFQSYRYDKGIYKKCAKRFTPDGHARFCVRTDRMIYHPMTAESPLSLSTMSSIRLTRRKM